MIETDLEMATRHLAQAERIVAEQRVRIDELAANGHEVTKAREILSTYEQSLALSVEHVARLTG